MYAVRGLEAPNSCNSSETWECSSRILRHLDFISECTTDIHYFPGKGKFVADSLSRICDIQFLSLADFELWENLQTEDEELKAILDGNVDFSGKLFKIQMPDANTLSYFEASGEVNRLYVPQILRYNVFDWIHGLLDTGIWASRQRICSNPIWLGLNKDVVWCTASISCQRTKAHLHTKSPLARFVVPDEKFAHIYIDIIDPLL